jgi:hypothetical protein
MTIERCDVAFRRGSMNEEENLSYSVSVNSWKIVLVKTLSGFHHAAMVHRSKLVRR